ncbi:hypothetical protein [Sphingomonas sp.]|jgi:hypothetical protein|uniref:hypothetical protein n=1 Tax=Sphingomonas sp. TaxID=28214 RepID=UPI002EDB714A
MTRIFRAAAVAPIALLATMSHAAQTVKQDQCLTADEASAMFTSVAPGLLRSASEACASALPAGAYLRDRGAALADRYSAPAAAAKPLAMVALNKIAGGESATPEMFDMITGSMIGALAAGQIKPKDCISINRVVELLDPLPPANMAGLVVAILELSAADARKPAPFQICKSPTG